MEYNEYQYWDNAYEELVETIYNDGIWTDSNVRTKYADGTPATYKAVAGISFRLDNSKNNAFLLTTKHVAWKAAVKEMYWIYIMQSNNVKDLQDMGIQIWNEWAVPGINPTRMEYIKPRYKKKYDKLPDIHINDIINTNPDKVYTSNSYGDYYVVKWYDSGKRADIQFLNTGSIKNVSNSQVYVGDVKDDYCRTVNGLGYLANYRSEDILSYFGDLHGRWVNTWENMVRRCSGQYSGKKKEWYESIFVSTEFHSCEYFLRWVMNNNNRWGRNYLDVLQIDKDYYKANYYGEDSCVLVTPKENTILTLDRFYKYDDQYFYSYEDLAQYINDKFRLGVREDLVSKTTFIRGLITYMSNPNIGGGSSQYIKIIKNEPDSNHGRYPRFSLVPYKSLMKAYAYQIRKPIFGYKNQLEYVVETLKKDPNSRRVMIDLWCPEESHEMTLTPCCYNTIYNILDGKLYMQLNIRSSDVALGLPFNIFQFQVLHKLIAHEVGVEPADMIVMISNLHYYDRHEEKLLKQLDSPIVYGDAKLRIEYPDSIWDFKPEMVHVDGYNHGPKIDFEIAI